MEPESDGEGAEGDYDPDQDDLLADAIATVIQMGTASTSMLQRRLRVGYTRAGRLIDMMERRGVISGYEGSKARQVLITGAPPPCDRGPPGAPHPPPPRRGTGATLPAPPPALPPPPFPPSSPRPPLWLELTLLLVYVVIVVALTAKTRGTVGLETGSRRRLAVAAAGRTGRRYWAGDVAGERGAAAASGRRLQPA